MTRNELTNTQLEQCAIVVCQFIFASRRRHTRWPRDWISDVCSSDHRTDGLDFAGREELAALVELPGHRQYVDAGSAHVLSLPHLVIEDDRAVATGYSRVYVVQGDGHRVARTSANRWELVRTAGG